MTQQGEIIGRSREIEFTVELQLSENQLDANHSEYFVEDWSGITAKKPEDQDLLERFVSILGFQALHDNQYYYTTK